MTDSPTLIYRGALSTRSYDFEAYGFTEAEAYNALKKAWNDWRRVSGATYTWRELYEGGDAYVQAFEIGAGYMDREKFNPKPE